VTVERRLQLHINGKPTTTAAGTVSDLLRSLDIDPSRGGTAVALNEALVPKATWPQVTLHDGDRLEIIHPVQGG
jgi:thiamine biosynthesis protein ThiS